MNLFEMFAAAVCLVAGVVGSRWAGGAHGPVGYLLGFGAGAGALPLGLYVWRKIDALRIGPDGPGPPCACGETQSRAELSAEHGAVLVCACGRSRKRVGGEVFLLDGGARALLWRWSWRTGWMRVGGMTGAPYR